MKIYEIPFAIRDALDRIEVDEETGEILNADALREAEAQAAAILKSRTPISLSVQRRNSFPRPFDVSMKAGIS